MLPASAAYTSKTNSKGICELRFDGATGKMSGLELAAESKDPSWVIVHPGGKYLYAANEAGRASTLSAFAIEPKSGKLTLLNELPALGEDPCHLSFDRTGKFLFVANYTSGNVVVFPIGADGKLGTATANVHDEGTLGRDPQRQEAPHAHWIEPAIDNRSVYVADLGLDTVLRYGSRCDERHFVRRAGAKRMVTLARRVRKHHPARGPARAFSATACT
jgi:6-phosphogluconolactonase